MLLFSGVVNVLLILLIAEHIWRRYAYLQRRAREYYLRICDCFGLHRIQKSDIIFLGDSITSGAQWHTLFPALPVRNFGIGGDTTAGVLARINPILLGRPEKVLLLIGTNDIGNRTPTAEIVANYRAIIDKFAENAPSTILLIQSVLPRQAQYRGQVEQVNQSLRLLAKEYGISYIDLYSSFVDSNGELQELLTEDKLHLTGEGYERWREILKPYLLCLALMLC